MQRLLILVCVVSLSAIMALTNASSATTAESNARRHVEGSLDLGTRLVSEDRELRQARHRRHRWSRSEGLGHHDDHDDFERSARQRERRPNGYG